MRRIGPIRGQFVEEMQPAFNAIFEQFTTAFDMRLAKVLEARSLNGQIEVSIRLRTFQ